MKKFFLFTIILMGLLFVGQNFALAAPDVNNALGKLNDVRGAGTGIASTSLPDFIGNLIKGGLTFVGLAFFALMVYAGFVWMTARGEEDRISKAKGTATAAVIGLAIVVSSYAITNLISNRLLQGKPGDGAPQNELAGCCIDWVASSGEVQDATAVSGIMSRSECQRRGSESDVTGDRLAGPEGEGYWVFNQRITSPQECRDYAILLDPNSGQNIPIIGPLLEE